MARKINTTRDIEINQNIVLLPYSSPGTKYLELVDAYERGIEKAFGLPKELMNGPREYARRMQIPTFRAKGNR